MTWQLMFIVEELFVVTAFQIKKYNKLNLLYLLIVNLFANGSRTNYLHF